MQRERVAEDIYVFVSDLYAQVTATVVATHDGAVLFDTMLFPEEARRIKRFVEGRLNSRVIRVINSHFHADHTVGTFVFEGAPVVAHTRCRDLLDTRGRASLEQAKAESPELREAELVLPNVIFRDRLVMSIGGKTFELWSVPGHSPDSIVCLVKEDRVLLAGDAVMALPHFVDGRFEEMLVSLHGLVGNNYEHIVQGHGDVILRGEIDDKLRDDLAYLHTLRAAVDAALRSPSPEQALAAIDLASCGKSPILLNGMASQLHRSNVQTLANQRQIEAS